MSRSKEQILVSGRHAARGHQLRALVPRLNDAGIVPLLLKGMALIGDVYAANERAATDIDVLVRPEQFERAVEIVRSLGYRDVPHPGRETTRERLYHLDFEPPDGMHGSPLEVHRHVAQPERYRIDLDGFWGRSHAIERHHGTVRLPAREDHVLVLAIHRARHADGFSPHDLRNVEDIRRLLRAADVDWPALIERAGRWRCRRVLFLALDSVGPPVPGHALRALAPGRTGRAIIGALLERRDGVWVRPGPRPGALAAWLRKTSMVVLSVDAPALLAVAAWTWAFRRALDALRGRAADTPRARRQRGASSR